MRPITHDDALGVRSVTDVALGPDGKQIAFALTDNWISGLKNPRSALWLLPTVGGSAAPITGGPQCDRLPRWSPDGKRLAFLSDRSDPAGGAMRLHLYTLATGHIEAVACPAGSVKDFKWSASGTEIAVLLESKSDDGNGGSDPVCFEARPHYWRVWVLALRDGQPKAVTPEGQQVWEFDWSPDQRSFVLLTSQTPFEWSWYQTRLAIVDMDGGPLRTLFTPGHRQLARPLFSPDGIQVAFLCSSWSDRGHVAGDLWSVPAAGGAAANLTPGYAGSISWMEWESRDTLLTLATEDFDSVIASVGTDGSRHDHARGEFVCAPRAQSAFSRVGNLVAVGRDDATHPADVWTLTLGDGGEWRQLTDLNPHIAHVAMGQPQVFRWRTFDGLELDGLLTLPLGYQPGQRYPVVVNPHGGPTSRTAHRFTPGWQQFLAVHGCAVFQPNFRGSTGRGVAFAEANLGDLGGGDFQDIMAGVDALVAAGIADPERLGFGGWSYGGFLSAWAATQTNRFKCIMMGAGIANWLSFHGRSYLQTWDELYLKGNPYTGDVYARSSPIHHVDRVKTPVLIVHGEKDGDVPVGQSYEFHRALVERGVRAELVVYPREPHGFREPAHLRDLWTRVLGWFTYYLELTE